MTRLLSLTALGVVLSMSVAGHAGAVEWRRGGTFVGPRGATMTRQGSASCANGSCASSRTVTGPGGTTYMRNGSVTVTPN
ncbi:MAG TPA: hypothetical protein VHB27_14280 [Rhodopila sp.]|uniref:hypothetical protein n=1 Tax=Rhodopila sp. TaxID=2480087 RepID=UPI002CDBAC04|nr:hypothetical protein [Rhodopila sp.]HVY16389.1 hypothetical protein [Rhodopila sp.]